MNINISWFAVLWKRIWGGKKAVFEYLLDKANTLVALLPGATKEKLQSAYEIAKTIYQYIEKLGWIVPAKWEKYYNAVMACYKAILDALADAKVTQDEVSKLAIEFQSAYAVWKSDDVEGCDDCCDNCVAA